MLWMESYFIYCSVRLGVMVISVLSFVSVFIPSILFFAMGLRILNPVLKLFNEDEHFQKHTVVKMLTKNVAYDSINLKIVLQLCFFAHMAACVLAFYGSLKLKKYFLLPIICFELWRLVYSLTCHILIMTVSKNRINLGILITSTLAGGFLILFLGYNWATCVALYQIINLINSERYKSLYGEDPFNPLIPKTYNPSITENVRVLVTPTNHDIDEQKKRNALLKAAVNKNRALQAQPIISVLPVNNLVYNTNSYAQNLKWKQRQWPTTTTLRTPPTAQSYSPNGGFSNLNRNNNNEINYNNWQWSEVNPAFSVFRNKKNIYLE